MSYREEIIGGARLILGDCRDVIPTLGGVDAVVTDPPYGIGADRNLRANKKHGAAAAASRDYGWADWDSRPPTVELFAAMLSLGRSHIIWGGNYFGLPPSPCWLVWDKDNGDNGYADCELAWTDLPKAVRKLRYRWMGMLQEHMADKEERLHPTQKPIGVMAWSLGQLSSDHQTILDPFMGSGTTGVACARLGRKFIGIECHEPYFDIAVRRIEQAQRQGDLLRDMPPAEDPADARMADMFAGDAA